MRLTFIVLLVAIGAAAARPPEAQLLPVSDLVADGHVVPLSSDPRIELLINIPQRLVFHRRQGALAHVFPIAVGRRDWPTPLGAFHVVMKEKHPTWDVPVSIQEEMRRAGQRVITRMPPGPKNPLGDYWIGLSLGAIGLHGTPAPSSVSKAVTHGCMRMYADDVKRLYADVEVGTLGAIVYQPVLLAVTSAGVFLEAQRDIYDKGAPGLDDVRWAAAAADLDTRIDWHAAADVLRQRDGAARLISVE